MIIRKPYAFLIKNFKKIHILLLVLAIYVYAKTNQTYAFVREFFQTNTYDSSIEPISKYINVFGIVSILFLIIVSAIIIRLLRRKDKPWKLYLIPVIQYVIIFFAMMIIRSYFNSYTGIQTTTPIRMWRDMLLVSQLSQFATFIVYLMRIFGVDLKKFNFKIDEEYLELESRDREELEININVDKEAFKRTYRKFMRNLNYVYQEHRLISNIIISIVLIIIAGNSVMYIMNHRSFKEGSNFNINGYEVKVHNSYYTDKSYNGTVISKTSSFVIVDLTIKNTASKTRDLDLNLYHVMNGVSNYTTTDKVYGTEFKDLGKTYDSVKLRSGESVRMIMVYKVDNKLKKNRFVLYYQEFDTNKKFLRKIKLKIKDYSKLVDRGTKEMGEDMSFIIKDEEENIAFDDYDILQETDYIYNLCTSINCSNGRGTYRAPDGYRVVRLTFSSDTFEGRDLRDFATEYGKVTYYDREGKKKTIKLECPISRVYYGKYLYVKVPYEIMESQSLQFDFIIRNQKYVYKIF
ncbi:MAG: DUF4352 domain-containing protein [Bacilli bacterium]|nr:DUF4352 domain-containing protein [Bacilli bacterium]